MLIETIVQKISDGISSNLLYLLIISIIRRLRAIQIGSVLRIEFWRK